MTAIPPPAYIKSEAHIVDDYQPDQIYYLRNRVDNDSAEICPCWIACVACLVVGILLTLCAVVVL